MKKTEIAKQLGKQAQQKGADRLCQHDTKLQAMLNAGGNRVAMMQAWYAGYDAALVQTPDPADRQRKLDLIWRNTGKEYRGLRDGKRSIMRWAKYGGGLIDLDAMTDAEVEEMASFYSAKKS